MDDARTRMVRFVGRAWDQVKSPLYRNAFYIMLASVIGNGLGLFFWIVAYRFYTTNDAGYAVAMVNTLTFFAGIASLGMPVALIRFLPETDDPPALVNTALTLSGVIIAVLTLAFMLGLRWWAPGLVVVFGRPEYIPIVMITAMAYTFGPVVDQAAIAVRRADLFFWRIVLFSVTKIPLPVVFFLWFQDPLGGTLGVFASWSLAFGMSVVIAGFVFLPRVIPGYRPKPRFSKRRLRPMFTFSLGNWAALVVGSAGTLLLPLLIINTLRTLPAESTAVYYAATTFAATLLVIPGATMTSLYAEASQRNAQRRTDERRAILLSLALLAPAILAMWAFGDRLLALLFELDKKSAPLAIGLPQILSLASIPVFLNYVFGTRVRVRKEVIPLIVSGAIVTAVTLAVGYVFLVWYGLVGLASAVVIGQAAATPYLFLVGGKPMEEETIEPSPVAP